MSSTLESPPLLLTEKEAAHLMRCCEKTLYTMRKQGKIPFMKLRGAIRYSRADLLSFIESESKTTTDNAPRS